MSEVERLIQQTTAELKVLIAQKKKTDVLWNELSSCISKEAMGQFVNNFGIEPKQE